jgi:hypothetical protein
MKMGETYRMVPPGAGPWGVAGLMGLIMVGILVLIIGIWRSARSTEFNIGAEGLRISKTLYGRTIPWDKLKVESARPVDLTQNREFGPSWRTNGLGLPGYGAGWFKLRNGEKALLFLTDKTRAVYIPTTRGYSLLLSVEDPAKFAGALAKAAARSK